MDRRRAAAKLLTKDEVRRIAANYREAAGVVAQSVVIQFPQSQKRRLRITPGLCFRFPGPFLLLHSGFSSSDVEIKMITAAEYRAWAEESLEWARNATTESSRTAYIRWAGVWLESALRVERLTALIEDRSKAPTPTAEYVWQLPPFHDWPGNRIETRIQKRRRSTVGPRRFDQLGFDFDAA